MHLALELDQSKQVSADPKRDLDLPSPCSASASTSSASTEPLIQKVGDNRIVVELAGIAEPARAKAIVQRSAFLEFRITDKTGALEKALPGDGPRAPRIWASRGRHRRRPSASAVEQLLGGRRGPAKGRQTTTAKGAETAEARGRHRAVPAASSSALIQPAGAVAGSQMPGEYPRARDRVSAGGQPAQPARSRAGSCRAASVLRWAAAPDQRRRAVVSLSSTRSTTSRIITGSNLEDAQAQLDPLTNGPIVTFQLDPPGGRKFGEETGKHVGDYMAILLDGRVQGRPPVIQSRSARNGQITLGSKTLQEAQDLALTLKAGALPIPLKIVEERQVGASLGEDSIRQGHHGRPRRYAARDPDHGRLLRLSGVLAVAALGALHPLHVRRRCRCSMRR